ncbi:proline dehydrogenase family protein [Agrococcus casei]|uniref:proline dehydrogenase family protein n=1 Tax=Agrococcus casei TaxID=343512 RepID=UPI003F939041
MILRATEPDTEDEIAQAAINRVRGWISQRNPNMRRDAASERLAKLLDDPKGLDFAIRFVDRVVRTEDNQAAAREFERLSRDIPDFLDWYLKFGISMGGGFGLLAPGMVVPIAKRALRKLVSHLVIDATSDKLGKRLAKVRESGVRLNVNLLGEAVLGEQEAERRLDGTMTLLSRDDVDYVSVKVSALAPQLNPWAFQQTVQRVAERLMPLYRMAANSPTPKFINLDMEEYLDLDLTIAVFKHVMSQPELRGLESGIVLQAYLPDALGALQDLTAWAQARVASGGAPIKVRVVKGANLAMERVESKLHGWPLAPVESKASADANFKRVLEFALRPENAEAVRIGIASHNLFDLAYGVELATRSGVRDRIDFEMLLGMASDHLEALQREVPNVVLYTPVVQPRDFDSAVAYLVRRLEENASGENFMSRGFEIGESLEAFEQERDRFLDSIDLLRAQDADGAPASNRQQDRSGSLSIAVADPSEHDGFFNEPDTDPSKAANREWASRVLDRASVSELGNATLSRNHIDDVPTLDRRVRKIIEAAPAWRERGADARRAILYDAAVTLGAYRGRLIEVMAAETGKTVAEGDPEVSEAIDFCRYYGDQAVRLEQFEHATPVAVDLTLVVPPWNFPTAIPVGGIVAALATGSTVIIKPAHLARRTAAVLCEALWEAGVPREVLVLCDIEDREVSQRLISHESVGRLILTGSSETAELFGSWRPDLPIFAETSGKNAITVTPSADFDLAVDDIVHSAFGHAGQKCSAASLLILVGSVGKSEKFRRQLLDAVQTLRVGYPTDPQVHVGPVIEPASGKLERALTTLETGESWLVEPHRLDSEGRLWSPGVRVGVQPGSYTHLTEFFGPHLSIIEVETLEEALAVQNGTDYGLTAGIHALDVAEVREWLDGVQAGNLYVNRGITGAIVRRQSFGGWKLSQVGPGAKAGGPNYLASLVDWKPVFDRPKGNVKLVGLSHAVATVIEAATPQLDFLEFDRVRAGANSDQRAWEAEFGVAVDESQLEYERNVLRYRPSDEVLVRLADDGTIGQLMRVLAAAARAGATIRISSSKPLPPLVASLAQLDEPLLRMEHIMVESDDEFHKRIAAGGALAPVTQTDAQGVERAGSPVRRIRLAGSDPKLHQVLGGSVRVAVYDGPVSTEGHLELLPFLREQAVSVTAHRYGNLDADFVKLKL